MTAPASGRCRTCGGRTVPGPDYPAVAAATRRLAERLLADIPPDPPEVIERRRAQLVAAAAGRPEPEVGVGRPRLVAGVWRWDGAA